MARTISWFGMPLVAVLCGGCVITPIAVATSVATSVGTNVAASLLFSEDKLRRDARAAYERAPPCAAMVRGVQNGRAVTVVRDSAWFDVYEFGDGRRLAPSAGQGLVMVDYEVANRSDADIVVAPRRLTVTDAQGRLFNEKAGVGGIQTDESTPDEGAILPAGQSWVMLSVFELPPGAYALMVPNGRTEADPEPSWIDGCRLPPPPGTAARAMTATDA
ncbi:MAG: hypothetical protein K2Y40_24965 [Reyranella sp.]|nr:hypothetical protein [Reyranella sp.]